jgi:hypothetical protein
LSGQRGTRAIDFERRPIGGVRESDATPQAMRDASESMPDRRRPLLRSPSDWRCHGLG